MRVRPAQKPLTYAGWWTVMNAGELLDPPLHGGGLSGSTPLPKTCVLQDIPRIKGKRWTAGRVLRQQPCSKLDRARGNMIGAAIIPPYMNQPFCY